MVGTKVLCHYLCPFLNPPSVKKDIRFFDYCLTLFLRSVKFFSKCPFLYINIDKPQRLLL